MSGPWWAFVATQGIAAPDFLPVTLPTFLANLARVPAIARLVLPDADYTPAKRLPVVEQIAARLRGTPGVAAVAYSTVLPFTSGTMLSSSPLKKRDGSTQQIQTGLRTVSAGYFAALGQRVVEGREFTAVDSASAQPAVVVGIHQKATPELARRAVESAYRNFPAWSKTPAGDRVGRLLRLAALIHPADSAAAR